MPQRGGEYCHAAGDGEQEEDVDKLHRLPYAPEYHGDYGDDNSMPIVMDIMGVSVIIGVSVILGVSVIIAI